MAAAPDTTSEAREQLLATASAIMRETDTVDISLAQLSRRSGLNSALVKYYFGNKAGLMKSLLDRDMTSILASVDALLASEHDPETKLRRHISAVVDRFYDVPYIQRLLMRLIRESEAVEAQRIANTYLSPIYSAYDQLIGEGVEAGVFREVDPQLFYFSVTGSVDRFFAARLFMRYCFGEDALSEELRDRYRAHLIDFIMAGLLRNG
ncbi:TetR family transcriptional regulator [Erythrobacter sp. SG61-1L]|uniref:TetR family transcriptional regulator n=1 Tax=Erythrobacter sp. SG61-1L TaxID=1603897 RepID=UPI0006C920D9|nr:TetR family transcriptional regulator [Erythrobacter sp. SG61-1L]KPL69640.1 TetR family transcriptional regulator [Erythrobacter sp. SG61-1L]